jgi:hypothetical protein
MLSRGTLGAISAHMGVEAMASAIIAGVMIMRRVSLPMRIEHSKNTDQGLPFPGAQKRVALRRRAGEVVSVR